MQPQPPEQLEKPRCQANELQVKSQCPQAQSDELPDPWLELLDPLLEALDWLEVLLAVLESLDWLEVLLAVLDWLEVLLAAELPELLAEDEELPELDEDDELLAGLQVTRGRSSPFNSRAMT